MDEYEMTSEGSEAPETPVSDAPASEEASPQPTPTTPEAKPERVNLQEFPDFRNYQAAMERRVQQRDAENARLQEEYDKAVMSSMDDVQRAEYRAFRLQQQLEHERTSRVEFEQQQQAMMIRQQRINEVANEYGVPVEHLANAENPAQLYTAALAYLKQQSETRGSARTKAIRDQIEANAPDLGGGGGYSDEFGQRAQRAIQTKDMTSLWREAFGGKNDY